MAAEQLAYGYYILGIMATIAADPLFGQLGNLDDGTGQKLNFPINSWKRRAQIPIPS